MKSFIKVVVLLAILTAFMPLAAFAMALTDAQVSQFTAAVPEVEKFNEILKKSGHDKALEGAVQLKPGDKTFEPYKQSVAIMKEKYPDDYKALNDIVTKQNFSSAENWAEIGDSVMLAYMADKIEAENPNAFKEIHEVTPEMKKKLPPEALAQIERAVQMMKIVAAAPAENKGIVKPHMAELDKWLSKGDEKQAATASANDADKKAPKGK